MKLHLSWDGATGICANNIYTNGALYTGIEYKPVLSFEYDVLEYSQEFNNSYIMLNGEKIELTEDEIKEIIVVANNWIQPLGQEGNPTRDQALEIILGSLSAEAGNHISNAYLSSLDGSIKQSNMVQTIITARRSNRIDKITNGIQLNACENREALEDLKLSSYEVQIYETLKNINIKIGKLKSAHEIMNYDLTVGWPKWSKFN